MSAPRIRAVEIGSSVLVLSLGGDLDSSTPDLLAPALAESADRTVIVDLLSARNVEEPVQDIILAAAAAAAAAAAGDVVVVADAKLLHVFDLRRTAPLGLETSLAAAVAGCG